MNTVIRKHIPASRVPEEFRAGIGPEEQVTVTVEVENTRQKSKTFDELLERIRVARLAPPIDDDPVERIRSLRDEWER